MACKDTTTSWVGYDAAAAYYDIFAASLGGAALPRVAFFADLAQPKTRVLDVGSGTGRIALAIAERSAEVYCLEPSPAMRAVLLSKLAARHRLHSLVTVLDRAAPVFRVDRRFDYACLAGVLQYIAVDQRPILWRTLREHMQPGGLLALDMVDDKVDSEWPERLVNDTCVGDCRYTLHCSGSANGRDQVIVRMGYRTWFDGQVVSEDLVERFRFIHRPVEVMAELEDFGFQVFDGSARHPSSGLPRADGGTLVARLVDSSVQLGT